MTLQPRERVLLAVVATLCVGLPLAWVAQQASESGPHRSRLLQMEELVSRKRRDVQEMQAAVQQLERWTAMSLPRDTTRGSLLDRAEGYNAQRLYYAWLTDLAKAARFERVRIRPLPTGRNRDYLAVQCELSGDSSYADLCELLIRFQETQLLHGIQSLEVQRSAANQLSTKIVARALVLRQAAVRSRLFPHTATQSQLAADATVILVEQPDRFEQRAPFMIQIGQEIVQVTGRRADGLLVVRGQLGSQPADHAAGSIVEHFPWTTSDRLFSRRPAFALADPFRRPAARQPTESLLTNQVPVRPPTSRYTYLVATIRKADSKEAWLYDRTSNRQSVVVPGSVVSIGSTPFRVIAVARDHLVVEGEAQERFCVELGASLDQLKIDRAGGLAVASELSGR